MSGLSRRGWAPLVWLGSCWLAVAQAQAPEAQGSAPGEASRQEEPEPAAAREATENSAGSEPRPDEDPVARETGADDGPPAQAEPLGAAVHALADADEAQGVGPDAPRVADADEVAGADEAPSAPAEPGAASASPEGGASFSPRQGLRVAGEAGSFELHLAAWLRFDVTSLRDEPTPQFSVPLARPLFRAQVLGDRVSFLLQPELAGADVRLLDLHVDLRIHSALQLRLGQFRTPYSRAYITPIVHLLLPTRGLVDDTFRLDRDTGLMVYGFAGDVFEYQVGVFNGARINRSFDAARAPMVVGRAVFNIGDVVPYDQVPSAIEPAGLGLALGVAGAFRKASASETEPVTETAHVALEATLMAGPVTATAEAFHRSVHPSGESWFEEWGTFAQAGAFLVPGAWDASARVGWMRTGRAGDETLVFELGSAVYAWKPRLGHHLKLNLGYRFLRVEGATAVTDHALRAQVQLSF